MRLSFHVPAAVRVAFEETHRLHASVAGRETGIAGFVEALVAEACAGPHPPDPPDPLDVARVPRLTGARARRETALDAERQARAGVDRACEAWTVAGAGAAAGARGVLCRLRRLEAQPWPVDAAGLQERLRQWLRLEDRLERRLGKLLVQMSASSPWSVQGYGDAGHFAEARLGLARSTAESRRGLARGLVQRPWLRRAYARGRIGAYAAQLVVRILGRAAVDPAAERAWVERAGRATVKRLRDEARAIELGRLDGAQAIPPLPLDDRAWQASLRQDPGALRTRVQALLARAAFDRRPNVFLHLTLPESGADDVLAAVDAARAGLAAACVRTFSITAGGGGSAATRGVLGAVVGATRHRGAWMGCREARLARRADSGVGGCAEGWLRGGRRGRRNRCRGRVGLPGAGGGARLCARRTADPGMGRPGRAARGLRPHLGRSPRGPAAAAESDLRPRGLALCRTRLHLAQRPRGPPRAVPLARRRCARARQPRVCLRLPPPAGRARHAGPLHGPRPARPALGPGPRRPAPLVRQPHWSGDERAARAQPTLGLAALSRGPGTPTRSRWSADETTTAASLPASRRAARRPRAGGRDRVARRLRSAVSLRPWCATEPTRCDPPLRTTRSRRRRTRSRSRGSSPALLDRSLAPPSGHAR